MRRSSFPVLYVALTLAGCAPAAVRAPAPAAAAAVARERWIADRLYFGRSMLGGGTVSEDEWAAFLSDVITHRFPDGLTVWRARGQWKEADGAIQSEDVVVVEILHPASAQADAALEEIAREYKLRFRQESVLRVRTPAEARFFE
ncbi:MAG TPA: DUF3574 domain-containing protein [Longimicrobium sp.]|jgi:hypothetical protein|nr:DUF3574 domain-containing protein [Longimicrobium sp.]